MALEVVSNMGWGKYVEVDYDANTVKFTVQNGPIKEVGENGCQIDFLLYFVKSVIRGLNRNFPCRENSLAITKIEEAEHWLDARTARRVEADIEGRDIEEAQ